MKRIVSILIISLLTLSFTGCGATAFDPEAWLGLSSPEAASEEVSEAPVVATPTPEPVMEVLPEDQAMEALSDNTVSEDVVTYEPVTIVFAGDINFDPHYANMNSLRSRGGEIADGVDEEIINELVSADIAMINNEFPYSTRGTPTPNKKFTFRSSPESVRYMTDMGIDIVGLANNHAYDHGPDALLDTLDTLSGAGIKYVGAGRNIEEAMTPEYFEIGGMKIAFTAATQIERSLPPDTKEATETEPGVLRTLDPEKYLEVIRTADENADFTIAFVHWGSENVYKYEAAQTELAEKYAEAGADLIIGAHPHVIQGFDYIGDVPVVYSMGNFWFSSKTLDSCIIKATLYEGKLQDVQFIPCVQKGCFTSMKHEGDGEYERIIGQEATRSSERATITRDGYIVKAGSVSAEEDAKSDHVPDNMGTPEAGAADTTAVPAPDAAVIPEGVLPEGTDPAAQPAAEQPAADQPADPALQPVQ